MKRTLSLLVLLVGLCYASFAYAETYDVLHRQHQKEDKAHNVEEANIYVIQCSSKPGQLYYIYQYFRDKGRPNFRAILPPNWGTPIGEMDYQSFELAICAACAALDYEKGEELQPDPPFPEPLQKDFGKSIVMD